MPLKNIKQHFPTNVSGAGVPARTYRSVRAGNRHGGESIKKKQRKNSLLHSVPGAGVEPAWR